MYSLVKYMYESEYWYFNACGLSLLQVHPTIYYRVKQLYVTVLHKLAVLTSSDLQRCS